MLVNFKHILFVFLLIPMAISAQEICDNGIDDDGDGLIDLNDATDCVCSPVVIPSLIPNPSFEQMNCCPSSYSQVTCASGWSQATSPTSDYMNTCGFVFGAATSAGLLPPDGNGMIGTIVSPGWVEYVGSCLSAPMISGQSYTLEFQIAATPIDGQGAVCNGGVINFGPIDITLYGLATCPAFPIGTSGCPPGWANLGSVTYTPVDNWGVISISFTPTTNINAIIIGAPCTLPGGYNQPGGCYPYFYYDNLVLNESALFTSVTQTGNWCNNDIQINTPPAASTTYQWYLEGVALPGETSTTLNVSTNNYGAGIYTLVSTSAGNCAAANDTVFLPVLPVPNFTVNTPVCLNEINQYTDNSTISTGSISSWAWNFGDGNSSILQNPSNTYSLPGTYTTTLVVTSLDNCVDSIQVPVTINPLPSTQFGMSNASGNGDGTYGFCLYDNVIFSDASSVSTGNITSWLWDFGDGNTSTLQNPNYNYTSPGNYLVELLTFSDAGCLDSITIPININTPPVADFTFLNDCYYLDANFTDNSSISSGTISNWNWSFGDGNTSTVQNPTNLYASDGFYDVSLTVVSDSGCVDSIIQNIERYPKPNAMFSIPNVCLNDSSCINDLSTISSGSIVNWIWNFGDGSPFTGIQNPCNLYSTVGTYNVSLILTSDRFCFADTTITTEVYPLPVANFSNTTICENTPPTVFTDESTMSTGNIANWEWDFGTVTSNLQDPVYNFNTAGIYPVELIVTSNFLCRDTIVQNVIVNSKPTADFEGDILAGCIDHCVNFISNGSASNASSIDSYEWDLGNSNYSSDVNSATCYTTEGSYDVSLIISNNLGCYDSVTFVNYITAYPLPVANFSFTPYPASIYTPEIFFENLSFDAPTYLWDFGDSTYNSTIYSPSHFYSDTGFYQVELDVYNEYFCHDSIIHIIWIQEEFNIYIPNSVTPNGDGRNDEFFIRGSGFLMEKFEFMIFNRWGELIYYTTSFTPWNCKYNNVLVQEDVYVYKVILKDITGKNHELIGHVSVLR